MFPAKLYRKPLGNRAQFGVSRFKQVCSISMPQWPISSYSICTVTLCRHREGDKARGFY
jgi:hypothetical protein